MKTTAKRWLTACTLATGLLMTGSTMAAESDAPEAGSLDQFIIDFRSNLSTTDLKAQVAALGGELIGIHERTGIAVVAGIDEQSVLSLRQVRGVAGIESAPVIQLETQLDVGTLETMLFDAQTLATDPSGAFFFPRQWHLRAIGAEQAWDAGKIGSPDVTVAILDTGIDYTYPDLAGLVDLSRSVSFIPEDDVLVELVFPEAHPIADLNYHGTHVAATVASNAFVAAGVTADTTLMGVKVCSVEGSCPSGSVLLGMLHAADNGADVINMSLGGAFLKAGSEGFHSLINRVLNEVRRQGSLVVVSAGNSAFDMDRPLEIEGERFAPVFFSYCDAPGVLCVSATGPIAAEGLNGPWTEVDAPAPYTNFGRSSVHVAAPGGAAAPVWAACSTFSLIEQLSVCQTGAFIVGLSGTSMSAPHVSGLAALLIAEQGGGNPALIRSRIMQHAEQLGQSGNDPFYGRGRISVPATLGLD